MKSILVILLLLPLATPAADITLSTTISCVSDESSLKGSRTENTVQQDSTNSKPQVLDWKMAENFGDMKSKLNILWTPKGDAGPTIKLQTTDKPHNLLNIRSRTESSLIVVSSTSNFYSSESWTFVLNFKVETMIATRVVSNDAGVGGELISYDCRFETM